MHRLVYSIGVFLLLCVCSFAGYNYHQVNVLRAQVQQMQAERIDQQVQKQKQQEMRTQEQEYVETAAEEGGYYLVEENGMVSVYQADKKTLYETTGILMDTLPVKLQEEIRSGKYVKSELELYSFLENYSS